MAWIPLPAPFEGYDFDPEAGRLRSWKLRGRPAGCQRREPLEKTAFIIEGTTCFSLSKPGRKVGWNRTVNSLRRLVGFIGEGHP